jgi:hypothetical protein
MGRSPGRSLTQRNIIGKGEAMNDPDQQRGLYGKYRVEKINGKPTGPVFVLAYATDPHARAALAAYAESCRKDYPQLSDDLIGEVTAHGGLT